MRYIPSSRYTLDEIAAQCRDAINRHSVPNRVVLDYEQVRQYFRYNVEVMSVR